MKINTQRLKQLRAAKGWSQEQLSSICNLDLRTIQRVESRGTASLETVRALAAGFSVPIEELTEANETAPAQNKVIQSLLKTLRSFDDFSGRSGRFEFWWFFTFFILLLAIAEVIHGALLTIVAIILLVPFIAVSTRRLRDAGQSFWWQLLYLVPFGQIAVLIMLALPQRSPR